MINFIKTLIIFLIAAASALSQSQQQIEWPSLADSPWPILRGDAQGTGRSEYVGPKTSNAHIIWTSDLPLGIFWGPTIGYNDYLFFGSFAVDSDNHNQFYAYYPNGTEYWHFETNSGIPNNISAIITKDSTVYMGSNSGILFAFSHNGSLKWISYINFGERMQLSLDKEGNIFTYSEDTLRVINPQGETILLKYFEKIASPIIFSPDGNTIYFKTGYWVDGFENYLIATDLSGNINWSIKFSDSNGAPAAVDSDGNIYIFGNDSLDFSKRYLYAITDSGNEKWKYPLRGYDNFNSPAIDNKGNVIFYCRNGDESLNYIVSLSYEGKVNWEYPLEHDQNPFFAQVNHGLVCDAEGNIFFGSTEGNYFYALNKWGELLWKIPLNGYGYFSSPAIGSDGTLYIGTSLSTFFQNHVNNLIAVSDEPNSVNELQEINSYSLKQNYPNPFNPSTVISYQIPVGSRVSLKVYDVLGNEIVTLVNEEKPAGIYEVVFNASQLSSGIYFYELRTLPSRRQAENFSSVKKMIYLK